MLQNIKQHTEQVIDTVVFGYDPTEFMPIRVDGKVANWNQFAAYKLTKLSEHAIHATQVAAHAALAAGETILEHMVEN